MNSIINELKNYDKFKSYLNNIKGNVTPIILSGLTDVSKNIFVSATEELLNRNICVITYNEIQAKNIIKDIKAVVKDEVEVLFFPKREIMSYDYEAQSKEVYAERIGTLNKIYSNKTNIIVTTIEAVSQKMISKEVLYKNVLKLKVGERYNLENIKENLIALGYERFDLIEGKGQFGIRGGILDIAISSEKGVRIEFFDDEIDSIRFFNIQSQRSTEMIDNINIYPAYEFLLERDLEEITSDIELSKIANIKERQEEDIEEILQGNYMSKVDKYFNSFYKKQVTLLDYLEKDTVIFLDEIDKIKARIENINKDTENVIKLLIEKEKIVPDALRNIGNFYDFYSSENDNKLNDKVIVHLLREELIGEKEALLNRNTYTKPENTGKVILRGPGLSEKYNFKTKEMNFFRSTLELFVQEMKKAVENKNKVIILNETDEVKEKVFKLLEEHSINGNIKSEVGTLSTGVELFDFNLIIITTKDLFEIKKERRKYSKEFKEGQHIVVDDLSVGDYVVHKNQGIAQFMGINTIKADNVIKDYIKLRFADDGILYVPIDSLDSVRKYITDTDGIPKLNKLGTKDWLKTKAKVKKNLREVAKELIELYAKRKDAKGYAFSKDNEWQQQFEGTFPYQETDDQLRCIEEVKADMEQDKPMDRLLCGDVGYGKTEVAIRAAFKACMDSKQVAYLVPTTILANQQYESFKSRMEGFSIKVEVLNRFRTKKEQDEIVKKLKLGEIDVVIGTHRILSQDVEFKNLGLLIIDEEHRFGVKAKEKIKQLKTNVDVLTMSATPIPRTLHMSIVGIRDMSVIYEPPQNRKPVQTYVLEYDKEVVREAITKELERGGQVFYLLNRVEEVPRRAAEIEEIIPEAKVDFAHGQMSGRELENIMEEFIKGDINVLVCTTILESGIDIPNANTIIVENADRLGLAQLYQIRGRVGRGEKQAYAYITYKRDKLLSEVAEKRLKAIKEFTEFGSGFKIAMRDLEIRGAGSLLGEIQHGHMESVGYDMYCKLLEEVIKEMQNENEPIEEEEEDVQIDISVSCFIPDEFISNSNQKIEIYQNIALCKTEEDIRNVLDELIDRYGHLPKEIENLLEVARIKRMCKENNIIKIQQKRDRINFTLGKKYDVTKIPDLIKVYNNRIKVKTDKENVITIIMKDNDVLGEIKKFFKL